MQIKTKTLFFFMLVFSWAWQPYAQTPFCVANAQGKTTSFVYDNMDRLIQRTDSLGNSEFFAYDGNGNLVQRTDRNGTTTYYQYDALNRLRRELDSQGTILASYDYDATGNLILAENTHSRNTFDYDNQNRLTAASTPIASIFYSYDANGNLVQMSDSEVRSSRVLYEYDGNDNLIKMGHSNNQDASFLRFSYDKGERRTGVAYPNGITASYAYVPGKQSQIQSLSYSTGTKFDYDYNLNDFVTSVSNQRSGITVNKTQNFQYDQLNQLTSATRPVGTGSETFAYDASGNRATNTTINDNNQLLSDANFNYTYDKNGNLTKRVSKSSGEITEFGWDYKNRLIQVLKRASENTDPTSTIAYKYDTLDRRIEKNVDGNIVRYVYDRDNIYLEYDGDDTFRAKYVHSQNVDEPVRMERPESPYTNNAYSRQEFYFHRDRLGNIAEITDFEGTVVQSYVYDAFGKVTIYDKDGNEITPSSSNYLETPYAFTGRELDAETGLYFYRARYYDPGTGRFLSEDPIEYDSGSLNLYNYVGNNSINLIDPSGNRSVASLFSFFGGFFGGTRSTSNNSVSENIGGGSGATAAAVGVVTGPAGPLFQAAASPEIAKNIIALRKRNQELIRRLDQISEESDSAFNTRPSPKNNANNNLPCANLNP